MKKILILISGIIFGIGLFAQNSPNIFVGDVVLQHGSNYDNPMGKYGSKLYIGRTGENSDQIFLARFNVQYDMSELRLSIGDDNNDKFVVGRKHVSNTDFTKMFVVHTSGTVGIMTEDPTSTLDVNGSIKGNQLDINGTIRSKEVKIEATGWADFVFNKDYKLPSLKDVEKHISEKGTLPNIPSEQEVKENGVDVGDMQVKLLQKIEELTLYVIEQEKAIKALKEENKELRSSVQPLLSKENIQ